MGEIISFPTKQVDEYKLTPELIREYKEALLLSVGVLDSLTKEQTVDCFWFVVKFNHKLMQYINEGMK